MVETAATIWADGPSSNPLQPDKAQIRAWGASLEAATNLFDGLDIRQYATEKDLFGQYAVEKIQEAIDANETDLLLFPKGIIPLSDSLIIWRTMTLRGIRDEMFWREYGDSTGTPGTPHPQVGTTFWTEGAGVSRVWTSMEDDDDPINPMLVLLGSQIYLENMSIRTGVRTGAPGLSGSPAGWHSARFIPGTRGHRARNISAQGLGTVGFKHGTYVDATNSKFNTALLALPHYSKVNADLFDVGPTDIRDTDVIWAGVKAFRVQGRTGSFPGGQNPYAPNGMSDMRINGWFYNDGPLADRQDHGALVDIDYKFPTNWADGSNGGQNANFYGRFDCAAKWSIKLGHCRAVRIYADYCETGSLYQSQTPAAPRAIMQTDSACTGAVSIVSGKWFSNIRVDEGTDVALYNFNAYPSNGHLLEYDGLESGEKNGLTLRSGGFDNNVIVQHGSTAASGEIRDVFKDSTGIDTYLRRRRRAAGKGEQSYDGASWFSYEEGTWTPVLRGSTTAGTNTYTSQAGSWRRNGNLVHLSGVIQITGSVDATMAGTMQISGLPFTSRNNAGSPAAMIIGDLSAANLSASTQLVGYIAPNTSVIALAERGNTGDSSITAVAKFGSNFRVRFEATYEI